jgi:glycosyltransferase involved in cell wall biosynthesis
MRSPKKILLSCFYFSPYRGGEAAVGWRYAVGLAKYFDVTVLYGDLADSEPMRVDVEKFRHENDLPEGLTVVHVKPNSLARFVHRLHVLPGCWFLYYQAYKAWQSEAFRLASRMNDITKFDLAHQLTVISFREPGFLWRMNIPFVWGPISGAAAMPWAFIGSFAPKGAYRHITRNLLNALQLRLPSRGQRAAKAAIKVWTATNEDRDICTRFWKLETEVMIETGANPKSEVNIKSLMPGERLILIWCGTIEDRKAPQILISALGTIDPDVDWELHVIGDGPDSNRCKRICENMGITPKVSWHGWVSHNQAQKIMTQGHVLIHSALKEGTPHVVLEAMALGMPVICHDACGMGVAVDESSGLKVEMRDPKTSVAGFREAILRLWNEPGLLEKLSEGALARARELSWDNKVKQVADAYREILSAK